jgi:hypothetical protein
MLADQRKRNPNATLDDVRKPFGASYRAMLDEVRDTLADLNRHFPGYAGKSAELAGFVWFQGWNDMISAEYTAEYAVNMRGVMIVGMKRNVGFSLHTQGVAGFADTTLPLCEQALQTFALILHR